MTKQSTKRSFSNLYSDLYNKPVSLTPEELHFFETRVQTIQRALSVDVEITNRDHESDFSGKHQEALGLFYTSDPKNPAEDCFITIDNYFIHECYETEILGKFQIEPQTLTDVICHELAHMEKFRHCKTHERIRQELLSKVNAYMSQNQALHQPSQGGEHMERPTKPEYTAEIFLSRNEAAYLNELLTMTGEEIYAKHGLKRDETFTKTLHFPDGCELDVKLVVCDEDQKPYIDLVLFDRKGCELACAVGEDKINGETQFETDSAIYKGIVTALELYKISYQKSGVYQNIIVEAPSAQAAEEYLSSQMRDIRITGTSLAQPGDFKPGIPIKSTQTAALDSMLHSANEKVQSHRPHTTSDRSYWQQEM